MKNLLFLTAFFLASCTVAPPPPQTSSSTAPAVRFGVEPVSAGVVRLTLDNGAPQPIGYNLCNSTLQQRSGSGWTPVATGEVCTMQLLTLNPGFDATFEKRLPAGLGAGEYRYVTSIENPLGTSQVGVTTDPFTVR
jgi:hypothetical protein